MKETVQQYMKRMRSCLGDNDPVASQAVAPRKLARLIRGVPRKKMLRRPAPGKWSVGELLAHLAETEMVGGYRIRMILGKNGTPIQAFEQDDWAREGHYSRRDPQKSLELFTALRKGNLALLRSLKRAQWKRYGMHAERGKESVEKIVRMFAGHDINHIQQIERILARTSR